MNKPKFVKEKAILVEYHKGDHRMSSAKRLVVPENWDTEKIGYAAQCLSDEIVLNVKYLMTVERVLE